MVSWSQILASAYLTNKKSGYLNAFTALKTKNHMASGLGTSLYISAEIISNHKGELGVESEAGKGATFYFDLPLLS